MGARTFSLAVVLLLSLSILIPPGSPQSTGGVRDGEPLHLWFKRSPTQDLTTLSFYDINVTDEVSSDPRYRHSIGPGGSLVAYFPTHPDSNFLQFEYNETLEGNYSLTLLGVQPSGDVMEEFVLKVMIDLDDQRNGEYDERISFIINSSANSRRQTLTGQIPAPSEVERFDGRKGGRVRITLQREDTLDSNVLLYCGYLGEVSYLNLPYSKYTYTPDTEDEDGGSYVWMFFAGAAIVILGVVIGVYFSKEHEKKKREKEKSRNIPRRRSGRRSG